jgi:AcrR family transcriptional regulator
MQPSVTKRTRLSGGERRERIVSAAIELMARRGYDAISVGEIAEAAGCSKAVLYDHFESKAALAIAAVEEMGTALMEHVAGAVVAAAEESRRVRLERGIDAFFEFTERNSAACRMVFRDPSHDPEVYAAHMRVRDNSSAAVAELLRTGFEGEPAPDHEEQLAVYALITTGLLAAMAVWWDDHPEVSRADIVRYVMSYAFLGLDRLARGEQLEP